MKAKRIFSTLTAMTVALTANCFTAYAKIQDNGKPYKASGYDASYAQSKPKLEVTKKVFEDAYEAAGQTVTITLKVSGENVDGKYCTTGFHVSWDDRLKVKPTRSGNYAEVCVGDDAAITELPSEQKKVGDNGVFLCTMGKSDAGFTGPMWTIDLQVPPDAKEGDVFPIDVYYDTEGKGGGDRFTNNSQDEDGKLMESYFFTQGINSKENPSDDEYLIMAGATFADGYIAIKGGYVPYYPTPTTTTPISQSNVPTLGDFSGDGVIDGRDATDILTLYAKSSAGGNTATAEEMNKGDVTKNGVLDARDATAVLTYYAKTSAGEKLTFDEFLKAIG